MSTCCSGYIGNTGLTSMQALADIKGIIAIDYKNSDGEENHLDVSSGALSASAIGFDNPDKTKRAYQIGDANKIKDVVPTPGDVSSQSYNDGSSKVLFIGPTSFTAIIVDMEPKYIKKIASLFCDNSKRIFLIDSCNRVIGRCKNDDVSKLYPLPLTSFVPDYNFAVAGTSGAAISLNFELGRSLSNGDLDFISADDIVPDLTENNSLLDVTLYDINAEDATTVTVKARLDYGAKGHKKPATGLTETAEWVVVDNAGNTLAVSGVTEDTDEDGLYTLVHADSTGNTPVSVSLTDATLAKGYEGVNTVTAS